MHESDREAQGKARSVNASHDTSLISRVLSRFQRITSSGKFIAEIDGLRFVAIASVAMFQIHRYLENANQFTYTQPDASFKRCLVVFASGWRGVEIFFVISGFILALPFATRFLRQGRLYRFGIITSGGSRAWNRPTLWR